MNIFTDSALWAGSVTELQCPLLAPFYIEPLKRGRVLKTIFFLFFLTQGYYSHTMRESMSPVCGTSQLYD